MDSIGGRNLWVYGRLIDEGWLPGNLEESRKRLDEDRNPDGKNFFERYNDLLGIAEEVKDGEKAEFLAETTFIVRMAQRDLDAIDSLETKDWYSDLDNYLEMYFGRDDFLDLPKSEYEDAYEVEFPPTELNEMSDFYRDTFMMFEGLKNTFGVENDIMERIEEYEKEYRP